VQQLIFRTGVLIFLLQSCGAVISTPTEQALQADSFVDSMGVNTHIGFLNTTYGNIGMIQTELIKSGIRHLRDSADNNSLTDGVYARMASLSSATGVKFNLIFDPRSVSVAQFDAQLASVGTAAVESIEGPNEYDISGDSNWPTVLPAYQPNLNAAVKGDSNPMIAAYPVVGFTVVNPSSYATLGNRESTWDFGNFHPYPGGNCPTCSGSNFTSNQSNLAEINPTKPRRATETGYYTMPDANQGISLTAVGKYAPRIYFEYFNAGIKRTYLYEFADDFSDPGNTNLQNHFGMIQADGTEKPSFIAISNLISILSDAGAPFSAGQVAYIPTGNISNMHHTLLQKRNGHFFLVLWLEVPSYNLSGKTDVVVAPRTINFQIQTPFSSANLYDPLVSTNPTPIGNPTVFNLAVKDSVQIVELIP
jgi:hypothetical protein